MTDDLTEIAAVESLQSLVIAWNPCSSMASFLGSIRDGSFVAEAKKKKSAEKVYTGPVLFPSISHYNAITFVFKFMNKCCSDFAGRNYNTLPERLVRSCFREINWKNYIFSHFVVNIPKWHGSYDTPLSLHCWSSEERKVLIVFYENRKWNMLYKMFRYFSVEIDRW